MASKIAQAIALSVALGTAPSLSTGAESSDVQNELTGVKQSVENTLEVKQNPQVVGEKLDKLSLNLKDQLPSEEYKSKIGLDYSKYGDMATNFQVGEVEYLVAIQDERGEDRQDSIELWELSIEDLYAMRNKNKVDGGLIDFFQEMTPNMVSSWNGKKGLFGLIFENQQAEIENQQAEIENQEVTSIINKLGKK